MGSEDLYQPCVALYGLLYALGLYAYISLGDMPEDKEKSEASLKTEDCYGMMMTPHELNTPCAQIGCVFRCVAPLGPHTFLFKGGKRMHTTGKGVEILLGVLFFVLGYLALRYIAGIKWKKDMNNRKKSLELFSFEKISQLGLGCIILQQRGSLIRDYFTVEAHHNYAISTIPDKHIYTSVSVGGVTTGGVSTIKGGMKPTDMGATGYYFLCYKHKNAFETNWSYEGIDCIVLPSDLLDTVKGDAVLRKYIVTEERRKDKILEYYPENSLNVSKMTFKDCLYLLDWLCGEIGSEGKRTQKKSLKRIIKDNKSLIILCVILILLLLLLFYQRTYCM